MLRCKVLVGLVLCVGCSAEQPLTGASEERRDTETMEFAGKTWTLVGPCDYGATFRPSMTPRFWTAGQHDERLHELLPTSDERAYLRIRSVERMFDGRWMQHGLSETVDSHGTRGTQEYQFNEPHGVQRTYYDNGQIKIERPYVNGQRHGIGRGWYENGKPMYEARYENDVEVSGKAWNEVGEIVSTK